MNIETADMLVSALALLGGAAVLGWSAFVDRWMGRTMRLSFGAMAGLLLGAFAVLVA